MDRGSRRMGCFTLLLIVMGVIVCSATLTFVFDSKCASDIQTWMPPYPGAEVLELDYDFFRPFAMGETEAVLRTVDDARTVRNWYVTHQRELDEADVDRGIATMNYSLRDDDEKGGTYIYLYTECASR